MDNLECSRSCNLVKQLRKATDKLTYVKDVCPAFKQKENLSISSDKEMQCLLCLLNRVIDALANEEYWCPNRDIIRLVMFRTLVENTISLRSVQAELDELSQK